MAAFDGGVHPHATTSGSATHYLGAVAALAIIAGIGVWSYDLIKRDVSGIPVVRAVEGDMRVLPENPGGEIAAHTGLAVNSVAAEGEAAELGDTLVLAPATPDLAEEDLIISPTAEADEVIPADVVPPTRPTPVVADPTDPAELAVAEALNSTAAAEPVLTAEDVQRLADELAAGVEPLEELENAEVIQPVLSIDGEAAVEIIATSIPGVTTSLRPVVRPATPNSALVQAVVTATEITPEARPATPTATAAETVIPAGTNLVQLGAFPSESDADAAWTSLKAKFGDYLVNKDQLIQSADSGGTTFYRLRALGFDDLSDARRFCAALEAGNADCIPVVVR